MEKLFVSIGEVLAMELENVVQVYYFDSEAYVMTLLLLDGTRVELQMTVVG